MPYYCHQVSYTKEAWARLMENPQDRLDAVRAPIEKLGGSLQTSFFAFGEFDVLAITEMPDNINAAAIAIAFAAGGAVSNIRTTPLLTASQAVEALRRAGLCGYKSITEVSKAATAPETEFHFGTAPREVRKRAPGRRTSPNSVAVEVGFEPSVAAGRERVGGA
jgi:uncharacterized protein with GYD domain